MKSKFLLILSVSLTLSSSALAEPTTAPQNSAGYGATNLEGVKNPFSPGRLEIKSRQVDAQAGYLQNNHGQKGGSVSLDLDKKYLIDGKVDGDGYAGAMLHPSFHGRLDVMGKDGKGNQVKTEIEIGGIAAYTGQLTSANRYRETMTDHWIRKLSLSNDASIQFEKNDACERHSQEDAPSCYEGLPENKRDWTDAQRADFAKREVPVYKVAIKPSTALEAVILEVTGVYKRSPLIKAETIAGKVQVLKLAGETSFRIGGQVQVDLCISGAGSVLLGQNRLGEQSGAIAWQTKGAACGGIQVGKVGRAGYEAGFKHEINSIGADSLTAYQQVSLSKIANSPVKAAWTHEIERSQTDEGNKLGGVTTNLFTVGGAF